MTQEQLFDFSVSKTFQDLSGREIWKMVFSGCLAEQGEAKKMLLPVSAFFLLCGGQGVGKRAIAEAFAGEAQKNQYRVLCIHTEDLAAEDGSLDQELLSVFSKKMDTDCLFLLLLDLDLFIKKKKKKTARTAAFRKFLEGCSKKNQCLITVATAKNPEKIPESIARLFQVCRLEKPDWQDLHTFYEEKFSGWCILAPGFSADEMIEKSLGYSYGMLSDLVQNLKRIALLQLKNASGQKEQVPRLILTRELFQTIQNTIVIPGHDLDQMEQSRDFIQQNSGVMEQLQQTWRQIGEQILAGLSKAASNMPLNMISPAEPVKPAESTAALVQAPHDPLEGLEQESDAMSDASRTLREVTADLNKGINDYTDEELKEMGFEPEKEIPESLEGLAAMSQEERAALFDF